MIGLLLALDSITTSSPPGSVTRPEPSLGVVGSRESNIILEETGEFLSEGRGELWSPVGDYLGVETELRENIGKKELSNSISINVFCARGINYPLHKAMVYHDHNQIISVGIGESRDEIHRYGREWEG